MSDTTVNSGDITTDPPLLHPPLDIYEPIPPNSVWIGRVVVALWLVVYSLLWLTLATDSTWFALVVAFAVIAGVSNEIGCAAWIRSRRRTFDSGTDAVAKVVGKRFAYRGGYHIVTIEFLLNGAICRSSGRVSTKTHLSFALGDALAIRVRPIRLYGTVLWYFWLPIDALAVTQQCVSAKPAARDASSVIPTSFL
ncbi:MAG: hypothetical protein SGJ20_03065 [Planctomycetota bacterium]|nr:hypothetical protein [Planctomycetota bacterium]